MDRNLPRMGRGVVERLARESQSGPPNAVPGSQNPKTFISYAREDAEFALKLADDLRTAGVEIWIDEREIAPGTHWDRVVQDALDSCARLIVVLSPASVASENVMDEVSYALGKTKVIIPALYRDCEVPLRLHRLQRVDVSGGTTELLRVLGVEQYASPRSPLRQAQFEPLLEYEGISGAEKVYSSNPLGYPQVVRIRNSQVAVENVAKDVSARIEYHHADGTAFTVTEAAWLAKDELDGMVSEGIRPSVSLAGNEQQGFVLMQIDNDRRYWASRNLSQAVGSLGVGRWTAKIRVSSSTCRSLEGTIGFTILPDNRLVYDQPAFSPEEARTESVGLLAVPGVQQAPGAMEVNQTVAAQRDERPEVYIVDWGENSNPNDHVGYLVQHGFTLRNSGTRTAIDVVIAPFELPIPNAPPVRFKSNAVPVVEGKDGTFAPIYREAGSVLDRWRLDAFLREAYSEHGQATQTIWIAIVYGEFGGGVLYHTRQPLIYSPHLHRITFGSPVEGWVPGRGEKFYTYGDDPDDPVQPLTWGAVATTPDHDAQLLRGGRVFRTRQEAETAKARRFSKGTR